MKRVILIVMASVMTLTIMTFTATESFATTTKKEITQVEFQTDIDCEGCVKKIMNYMPYQKGVKRVDVDLPTKKVSVSYDTRKTSTSTVAESFEKIDVKATIIESKE